MKQIYLVVVAVIFSINAYTQAPDWSWAKGMGEAGSDAGNSIAVDGDGNFYTTGSFVGTVDFDPGAGVFNLTSVDPVVLDAFICKTDSAGNFVWAKAVGGMDVDVSRSVTFDPSGSGAVVFSGQFKGTADFDPGTGVFNLMSTAPATNDIFICKLDSAGNFLWAKSMGGASDDVSNSSTIDPNGSGDVYCIGNFQGTVDFDPDAGVFNLTSAGLNDIFVSKYNSSGNLIWAKAMGGPANDWGIFISRCPAGSTDVYTTGFFSGTADFNPGTVISPLTSAGSDDIFISKLDSSGNFVWAKALGGTSGDYSTSIASDISGNVYTTGRFSGIADFNPGPGSYPLTSSGGDDIFICKLDNSGNLLWAKGIGSGMYDIGSDIKVDYFGKVYTIGGFNGTVDFDPGPNVVNLTSAGNTDIFISALDNNGFFDWIKEAGGTNGDNARALVLDAFGHIAVTGAFSSTSIAFGSNTLSSAGQSDIFIARFDSILTTGIETISNDPFPVSIFPNPFTDELTVNSSVPGEIKIHDMCGRLVYSQMLTTFSTQRINATWQKGIYFIEIITDEGRVVRKVMKQ